MTRTLLLAAKFSSAGTVECVRRFLTACVGIVGLVVGLGLVGAQLLPTPQRQYLSGLARSAPVPSLLSEEDGGLGTSDAPSGSTGTSATVEPVITAPPAPDDRIVNVLVIGSDVRTGEGNTAYGSAPGQRSDTTMIVQVNPYSRVTTVVSIPRDLWLRMPECAGGRKAKFNTAFSLGGADCTLLLTQTLTGLRFDHVVVVDFNAFKQAVQALGGVSVCLNGKLRDEQAGLDLPSGVSVLTPEQALALARSRHSTAAGSDIARIDRQHYLLTRIAREAVEKVKDPVSAFRMLSAVQPHLVVDQAFDTWSMAYLALGASGSRVDAVTFPWRVTKSIPWGSVGIDVSRARPLIIRLKDPQAWEAQQAPPQPIPSSAAPQEQVLAPVPTSAPSAPSTAQPLSAATAGATPVPSVAEPGIPCVD